MSNHNHYETVGKVIFSVKEQTDAHLLSDDTGFSDEQIYYYLLQCRSLFLYRKYRTYRDVSQKDYMTTPCMNLIDADNQCPCKPPTGCEILMTELYLPNMIGNIISVINPDGTKEYTLQNQIYQNIERIRESKFLLIKHHIFNYLIIKVQNYI